MNSGPILHYLNDDPCWFPSADRALSEPDGLLAIGGDLSPTRVFHGYQQGIFPWFSDGEPIMWWSPDPRAVIHVGQVRVNKTLAKFLRKCNYSVSVNTAFDEVIRQCAKHRTNSPGTWIVPEMINCYQQLHQQGKAHSIEIWQIDANGKQLVGGLYGVLAGSCFSGESMFSLSANASKLALLTLESLLEDADSAIIDCQLPNPHLTNMGAVLLSRDVFLQRLAICKKVDINQQFNARFIDWRKEFSASV